MNRLTNKRLTDATKNGYFIEIKKEENIKFPSVEQLYEKLARYEDVEEECGIDLVTLFDIYNKLCEQKFVYMKIGYQIKCFEYNHYVIDFKNKEIIGMEYEPDIWLSFKDYGIVWALTKEVLENDR